tara:strand:- start:14982 stop:15830 length:849 start_codon:yes stop_codon:yes gene_type:complete
VSNKIYNKIKIPPKISHEKIEKFFIDKKMKELVDLSKSSKILRVNEIVSKNLPPYPPILEDLYRLYQFIVLNKRTTILEFGSGWSSLIFSISLSKNKNLYSKEIKELRRNNPFELFVVENKKKYLSETKKKINFFKNKLNKVNFSSKINWNYSDVYMDVIDDRYCTQYKNLPLCNPDFIYLDGPNLFSVKNKINNFTTDHKDLMPMVGDIIKFEYFLTPGTIIVTDGRSANAQFLRDSFKRNWLYAYDKNFDQHLFYLNAESLGKWNNLQLKFYSSKLKKIF